MWIFLPDSFLSIVDKGDSSGKTLLIRGRVPGDIERVFPKATVEEGTGSDYRFRARLPREEVVNAIAESVSNINWSNFKNQVNDSERHMAYLDSWYAMYTMQERARKMGRDISDEGWIDDGLN